MMNKAKLNKNKVGYHPFNNMASFLRFIDQTPTNKIFSNESCNSKQKGYDAKRFTNTNTFGEAMELCKHGWHDKAKEINKSLTQATSTLTKSSFKSFYSVAGHQVSVARYLQGVPQNMIQNKRVQRKAKIVNLYKDICYSGNTSQSTIYKESVGFLSDVKALENAGYRVNVYVFFASKCGGEKNLLTIKVKNANERMNISKLAFPLTHPSMLRRLMFRFTETAKTFTSHQWTGGYGRGWSYSEIQEYIEAGDLVSSSASGYGSNDFKDSLDALLKEVK